MKAWSNHTRATTNGERELSRRLSQEAGIAPRTAGLFASARIGEEDLDAVMRAAGVRFVKDMPDYRYGDFAAQWPDQFANRVPHPSKDEVAAQFGELLADAVRSNLKRSGGTISWGQLLGRGGALYRADAKGQPMPEWSAGITHAVSDTITWFDFKGAGSSVSEQHAVTRDLANKAQMMQGPLRHLGVAPPQYPPQCRLAPPPSEKPNPGTLLRDYARKTLKAMENPATPRVRTQLEALYVKIEHMLRVHEAADPYLKEKRQLEGFMVGLPTALATASVEQPEPTARRGLFGFGQRAPKPVRRPVQLLESDPAYIPEPTEPYVKSAPEDPPKVRSGGTVHQHAATLASAISFINSSDKLARYENGAAMLEQEQGKAVPLNSYLFMADRILGGHDAVEELSKSGRKHPNERSTVGAAYCLAQGLKPLFEMHDKAEGEPYLGKLAESVIASSQHYAPGSHRPAGRA